MMIQPQYWLIDRRHPLKALSSFVSLLMLTDGAALGIVPTPKEMRGPFPIMSTPYFAR